MCSVIRSLRQAMNACFECLRSTRNTEYWRVWFEIDSLLFCQIFVLSEAGDALGTAEDGTITRYDEETKEPDRWWRRWTCHCIAIIWYYMLLLLCLPPGHGLCRSVSFFVSPCDDMRRRFGRRKRHRSRVTVRSVRSVSHCESLWVTGHEANPAWNWVGLGPSRKVGRLALKLAHDKSQAKTPHTSPYCIPYTGWWVVFRVTFWSAPFSLFESLRKVSESGQSGWAMVSSDLRIKHAAA